MLLKNKQHLCGKRIMPRHATTLPWPHAIGRVAVASVLVLAAASGHISAFGQTINQQQKDGSTVGTVEGATPRAINEVKGTTQAKSDLQADSAQAATVATAMRQFSSAVNRWATIWATAVPWNRPNTTNPINYQLVYLWASSSNSAVAGSAAQCNFPTPGSGQAVPGISGPVKLSTASITLPSGSQQADAIRSKLQTSGIADGSGAVRLLPPNFGGDFRGVFCASVVFNYPTAKKAAVTTWFVPATTLVKAQARASGSTSMALMTEAARKLAAAAAEVQPNIGVGLKTQGYTTPK